MKKIKIVQFRLVTTTGEAVAFNDVEGFGVGDFIRSFDDKSAPYDNNQPCITIKTRKGYVEFNLSEVKDISFHVIDTDASLSAGLVVASNYIEDDPPTNKGMPPINKGRGIGDWSDRE